MAKRKAVSPRVRFEVFKRDSFTCQYCGKKAPDVVLNVDHIDPVANGGTNELFNLLTSCFECNSGKRDKKLSDSSELSKQQHQLTLIQERRNQLKMLKQWRDECANVELEMLELVESEIRGRFRRPLTEEGRKKFKKSIRRFGLNEVLECITIAAEYYQDAETAMSKIDGIAINRQLEREDPDAAKATYASNILRKRFDYVNEGHLRKVLSEAIKNQVDMDSVVEIARKCARFGEFIASLERYNEENG